ncbi:Hypothetical predicted protein [Lecanosticta acicola]|uniref:Uncharacterized protein n=1 Tax=Lecanosticta acicola TaxID=111012 RepID=A0AAI8YYG1_9PEZI|nr:Hypothetical predicted protein [Lecanosticta acicola]
MSISRLANTYTLSGYREQILANAVHLFPKLVEGNFKPTQPDESTKMQNSRSPFDVVLVCKNEGTWSNKTNWRAHLVYSGSRTAASGCFKTSELQALGSLLSVLGAALREKGWEVKRKKAVGEGEVDGALLEETDEKAE